MNEADRKPTLCIDFDGVIHSCTSGWKGVDQIPDPPTNGWWDWAIRASEHFDLQIYSSRSKVLSGRVAIRNWLTHHWNKIPGQYGCTAYVQDENWLEFHDGRRQLTTCVFRVTISAEKPAAFLTIDDRAWCFVGRWPPPELLLYFKTWQEQTPASSEAFRGYGEKLNGDVVVTMTRDDWSSVLMLLGYATGARMTEGEPPARVLALLNRMNVGNPNYTPYPVASPVAGKAAAEEQHE